MIELKIEGCCKGCKYIDLKLTENPLYFANYKLTQFLVICKHRDVCKMLDDEKHSHSLQQTEAE